MTQDSPLVVYLVLELCFIVLATAIIDLVTKGKKNLSSSVVLAGLLWPACVLVCIIVAR